MTIHVELEPTEVTTELANAIGVGHAADNVYQLIETKRESVIEEGELKHLHHIYTRPPGG